MMLNVGINGYGPAGRRVLELALADASFRVRVVNDPAEAVGADSIKAPAQVGAARTGGAYVPILGQVTPETIPWRRFGVDYVIETTPAFADAHGAAGHLKAGARRVVLAGATPDPQVIPAIMPHVNGEQFRPQTDFVVAAGPPLAAAIATMLHAVAGHCGITRATVQPAAPAAGDAMAAREDDAVLGALTQLLPELHDRVLLNMRSGVDEPLPLEFLVRTERETNVPALSSAIRTASEGELAGALACANTGEGEAIAGGRHSCVFDPSGVEESGRQFFRLLAWFSGGAAHPHRVLDLVSLIAVTDPIAGELTPP